MKFNNPVHYIGALLFFSCVVASFGCGENVEVASPAIKLVDDSFSQECKPVTFDGHTYDVVQIGYQCWFAENLRTEHYTNGDAIPANLSMDEYRSTNSGAVVVYGDGEGEDTYCMSRSPDGDACDPVWSLNEYGRLYNWYAVDDARGLCPTGWHVPTDGDWTEMTDYLGGESVAGGEMKTTYGWDKKGNGTNSSGFSGLPGGFCQVAIEYILAGRDSYWWSSSPADYWSAWSRHLHHGNTNFSRSDAANRRYGYSVRCLKD